MIDLTLPPTARSVKGKTIKDIVCTADSASGIFDAPEQQSLIYAGQLLLPSYIERIL